MTAGSVSISASGAATKSGMAGEIYDQLMSALGGDIPSGADGVPGKENFANLATAIATGVVSHIVANAQVPVSAGGLQTYVVPPGPATGPTGPPVSTVNLSVT